MSFSIEIFNPETYAIKVTENRSFKIESEEVIFKAERTKIKRILGAHLELEIATQNMKVRSEKFRNYSQGQDSDSTAEYGLFMAAVGRLKNAQEDLKDIKSEYRIISIK